jgi:hypothetical protein
MNQHSKSVTFDLTCPQSRAWLVLTSDDREPHVVEMCQQNRMLWPASADLSPGEYRCRYYAGDDQNVSYFGPASSEGSIECDPGHRFLQSLPRHGRGRGAELRCAAGTGIWACWVPTGPVKRPPCGRSPGSSRRRAAGCLSRVTMFRLSRWPPNRCLAYVPDDPKLFDALTVWEHLQFIAAAYDVKTLSPMRGAAGSIRTDAQA